MITATLQKFSTILPQPHLDTWNRLLAITVNNPNPVMICLAGNRGLGKTSILNMLMQDAVLPTGKDSIQIPVVMIYGEAFDMCLLDASGQKQVLDAGSLSEKLANFQDADARLEISTPLEWLRGAELVDVPHLDVIASRYADWFPCTVLSGYWSGTTHASSTDEAWLVHFDYGSVYSISKSGSYCVRAVRLGN